MLNIQQQPTVDYIASRSTVYTHMTLDQFDAFFIKRYRLTSSAGRVGGSSSPFSVDMNGVVVVVVVVLALGEPAFALAGHDGANSLPCQS